MLRINSTSAMRMLSMAWFTAFMTACSGSHVVPATPSGGNLPPGATHTQATSTNATLTLNVDYLKFDSRGTQHTITASVNSGMVVYANSSAPNTATVSPASAKADPTHPATFTVTSAAWGSSTITITNKVGLTSTVLAAVSPWIAKGAPLPPTSIVYSSTIATTLNNTIYVADRGYTTDFSAFATALTAYNTTSEVWQTKASSPPRIQFGFASVNGLLYETGGMVFDGQGYGNTDTAASYNPNTDAWTTIAPIPQTGTFADGSVVGMDKALYALLGNYWDPNAPKTLFSYNPTSNKWSSVGEVTNYGDYRLAIIDKQIYMVGNYGDVVIFNPAGKTFTTKYPTPAISWPGSVFALNNTLYAIATPYGSTEPLPQVYAYNSSANAWSNVNAPTPLPNLMGMAVAVGTTAYLVGRDQCNQYPILKSCADHTYVWTP